MNTDFPRLWEHVIAQFACNPQSVHGPEHWRRVERNGLLIAARGDAHHEVVRLFAVFHDSRREHDGWDTTHGERGAAYAATLRGNLYELSDAEFELLVYACTWHTHGQLSDDPTIGACWDADRLDLGRVGIEPEAEFMSTAVGKQIAELGSVQGFVETVGQG